MNKKRKDFTIRYDQSAINYITQFLVSPSGEDVLIDFSSGLLNDDSEPKTLPIQNRIALSWSTMERLAKVLGEIVDARNRKQARATSQSTPHTPIVPQASIPQVSR